LSNSTMALAPEAGAPAAPGEKSGLAPSTPFFSSDLCVLCMRKRPSWLGVSLIAGA
jgi:hypothetical protein